MSHNVENMFYAGREKPWHGLGRQVHEALTAEEAIKMAGLDWNVVQYPVCDQFGQEIPGYRANTRDSDMTVLGIVGSRYSIVQNQDAFDFTDSLIGEGLRYETAGSLKNGKQVWLLGKMPDTEIAGDKIEPYVCFTNTHDGSGAVRVCMTPIRVVCNNTLNFALSTAEKKWSTIHKGNINGKLADARATLGLIDVYMKELAKTADSLVCLPFFEPDVLRTIEAILKVKRAKEEKAKTKRQENTEQQIKDGIIACLRADDLANIKNTAWGFVNAVADYVGHSDPLRKTPNWQENRFATIVAGHPLLNAAFEAVTK